jgi:hypothetical protein
MGVNETAHRLRGFAQARLVRRKLKESLRLTLIREAAKADAPGFISGMRRRGFHPS